MPWSTSWVWICMKQLHISVFLLCYTDSYLSPLLFGMDKAGAFPLHVSHLASSKRSPLKSLSTRKDQPIFSSLYMKYAIIYAIASLALLPVKTVFKCNLAIRKWVVDSPRTLPGGHWHFPSSLRLPGQRIHPNPPSVTACKEKTTCQRSIITNDIRNCVGSARCNKGLQYNERWTVNEDIQGKLHVPACQRDIVDK